MNLKPGDVICFRIGGPGWDCASALVLTEPVNGRARVWDAVLRKEYEKAVDPQRCWLATDSELDETYLDCRDGQKVRRTYRQEIADARERYGL